MSCSPGSGTRDPVARSRAAAGGSAFWRATYPRAAIRLHGVRRPVMDQGEQVTGGETPQTVPGTEQPVGEPKPTEPVAGGVRHTRISGAWTSVAVAALLGVALIAFIVQNTQKVQIKFFGASGHITLVVALLAAAIIGALIVLVVGISRITQLRLSARRRSKRMKEAENYPSSSKRRPN
jgi:uncharacterized integral membrane protein